MNKLLVIMSILSLFYGVSSLSYAEEVKGLEDMIRDGDEFKVTPSKLNLDLNYFDDFSNYSNSRRDRFVRLDPENERKVFQMLENIQAQILFLASHNVMLDTYLKAPKV